MYAVKPRKIKEKTADDVEVECGIAEKNNE